MTQPQHRDDDEGWQERLARTMSVYRARRLRIANLRQSLQVARDAGLVSRHNIKLSRRFVGRDPGGPT